MKKWLALACGMSMLVCVTACGGSDSAESSYSSDDYSSSYDYDDTSYGDGYGYDEADPYYSTNDHNNDGYISDEEFEGAFDDAIEDLFAEYGY